MYLSHLTLSNFRNYNQLDLNLGPGLFLFHGDNAQGKTNLLEAVSMLATGSSFHASSDREMVNWYAPEHIAHLVGKVQRHDDDIQIEMSFFDPAPPPIELHDGRSTVPFELPAGAPRKRIKLNGGAVRADRSAPR